MPRGIKKAIEPEEEEGIQNYELPKSIVTRLAKGAVPEETKLQKEVPLSLVKGSSIFINYLSALSHDCATDHNNKTISAVHVLEAVRQLGWDDASEVVRELKKDLYAFREVNDAKKAKAKDAPAPAPGAGPGRPPSKAKEGTKTPTEGNGNGAEVAGDVSMRAEDDPYASEEGDEEEEEEEDEEDEEEVEDEGDVEEGPDDEAMELADSKGLDDKDQTNAD